jgi:hypothetical protein
MLPMAQEDGPGAAESDVSMALGAAFGGALVLSQIFGVQTHADLLLLLAIVAGIAFVFEKVVLAGSED